jgi:iron complex transport system substrate-binding protein
MLLTGASSTGVFQERQQMTFHFRLAALLTLLSCSVSAASTPSERIVSIDGAVTEIIYALGAEASLVGVDSTSRYPKSARELPNVGYMRALSSEGIMALAPQRVITSSDAGPEKVLKNLEQAGLDMVLVQEDNSVAGVQEKIMKVAKAIDRTHKGKLLAEKVGQETLSVLNQVEGKKPVKILFLLAAGGHGVMVAGKDTQASAMIDIIGGINVADQFTSYKPLTPESAVQLNPDALVIANTWDQVFDFEKFPTLKLTNAYKNKRIVNGNSMLLLGFGPRISDALQMLVDGVYADNNEM